VVPDNLAKTHEDDCQEENSIELFCKHDETLENDDPKCKPNSERRTDPVIGMFINWIDEMDG
jgi:hypothetical protein